MRAYSSAWRGDCQERFLRAEQRKSADAHGAAGFLEPVPPPPTSGRMDMNIIHIGEGQPARILCILRILRRTQNDIT